MDEGKNDSRIKLSKRCFDVIIENNSDKSYISVSISFQKGVNETFIPYFGKTVNDSFSVPNPLTTLKLLYIPSYIYKTEWLVKVTRTFCPSGFNMFNEYHFYD